MPIVPAKREPSLAFLAPPRPAAPAPNDELDPQPVAGSSPDPTPSQAEPVPVAPVSGGASSWKDLQQQRPSHPLDGAGAEALAGHRDVPWKFELTSQNEIHAGDDDISREAALV
jgi:hypothetical protein